MNKVCNQVGCDKPRYSDKNTGQVYDKCRRGCVGVCNQVGCNNPRYSDINTGQVFDKCRRGCSGVSE
jgi:hypothetical protein